MFLYDLVHKLDGLGSNFVRMTGDNTYDAKAGQTSSLFAFSLFGEDQFDGATGAMHDPGSLNAQSFSEKFLQRILANQAMKINNKNVEGSTLQRGATAVTSNGDTIQQFNNNTTVTTKSDGTTIQTDANGVMTLTLPSGKVVALDKMTTTITTKEGATTSIWGDPHVTNADGTRQELDKIGDYSVDLGEGATLVLHANYMGANDPTTSVISSADIVLADGTRVHHDVTNASEIVHPDGTTTKTEAASQIEEEINTIRDEQVTVARRNESGSNWERQIETTTTVISEKDKKLLENTRLDSPIVKTVTTTRGGSVLTSENGNVVTNTEKADKVYEFIATGTGYAPPSNDNLDVLGRDAGFKAKDISFVQPGFGGVFGLGSYSGMIGPTVGSFWNFNSFFSLYEKESDPEENYQAIKFNYARTAVTDQFEAEWDRQFSSVSERVLWERRWSRD